MKMRLRVNKLDNNQGVAMVAALVFTVVLIGIAEVFVLRAIHESKQARIEREQAMTFHSAQGASELAIQQLDVLINDYLQNTILNSSPSGVITYTNSKVNSGQGIEWLVFSVRNNNVPVLAQNGDQAEYSQSGTVGNKNYTYSLIITEKEDPHTSGSDAWDFPFNYRIEATSTSGSVVSNVILLGDFTVQVLKDNFAKFALFTNTQTMPSGTNVWFTDKTNFAGPVHTNDRFNFALNPSGTFEEVVTQHQQTARFYNGGANVLYDGNSYGTSDVPIFNDTFTRNVGSITLSAATQQSDMVTQAQGSGGGSFSSSGIYVPAQGSDLSGGIYVNGDSTVNITVDASNNAVYTITQGSTTKKITVNQSAGSTTVENLSTGAVSNYNGLPDGIDNAGTLIYVNGNITGLQGTVQADTQVTVASSDDMVISNHVQYSSYTPAVGTPGTVGYVPPNADGATNMLGLVSWGGDVRVGTSAPNNVNVHGTVLAENGIFAVDSYNNYVVRGTATLLGGAITNNYGAFGLFNGSTGQQVSGYGRNFVYDSRMQNGQAPPYFPTLDTFIAFTNDIADKIVWQEGQ